MKKVELYIWGGGRYGREALHAIRQENCHIKGIIDNKLVLLDK